MPNQTSSFHCGAQTGNVRNGCSNTDKLCIDNTQVLNFGDCFTPTELVLMEDLGFSARGTAWQDVLDGFFDLEGGLPVNPDGGLKSFGHPIGASGLRLLFECWLQLSGKAEQRQLENPQLGLTHNLGGQPGECVSFVSIVGNQLG